VSKLPTWDELPDIVYEFVPSLIIWMVCCWAAAGGSVVVMVVAATTIAVITAMRYILVTIIPNPRVPNTFKRMVRKFRIYLNKKLKVENSSSLALKRVNFYCICLIELLDEQFVIHRAGCIVNLTMLAKAVMRGAYP
jgi:hypothetical protein